MLRILWRQGKSNFSGVLLGVEELKVWSTIEMGNQCNPSGPKSQESESGV